MKKHKREYAEELAQRIASHSYPEDQDPNEFLRYKEGIVDGYMKAIEETGVVELVEALEKCKGALELVYSPQGKVKPFIEIAEQALKNYNNEPTR